MRTIHSKVSLITLTNRAYSVNNRNYVQYQSNNVSNSQKQTESNDVVENRNHIISSEYIDFRSLTSNDGWSGIASCFIVPLRETCADVTMKMPVFGITFILLD